MGLDRLSCPDKGRLKELLAKAVGVPPTVITNERLDLLLSLVSGTLWSQEHHLEARELAEKISRELEMYSSMNRRSE